MGAININEKNKLMFGFNTGEGGIDLDFINAFYDSFNI
jgi:hypothetical protein